MRIKRALVADENALERLVLVVTEHALADHELAGRRVSGIGERVLQDDRQIGAGPTVGISL
jgi:hypothetical protein